MGVSPAQLHRWRGALEAPDLSDLGHEDRGEDGADAGDGLDGAKAGVVGQEGSDQGLDGVELALAVGEERSERVDPGPIGRCQLDVDQELGAQDPEEVAHVHRHALFGQHGMDLGLEAGAQVDELGPIADQLTQLTQRRWGHPALGQAPEAQQVDEVGRVALVVLHAPAGSRPGRVVRSDQEIG